MDTRLLERRESALNRYDQAWADHPEGRGAAFEAVLAEQAEVMQALAVAGDRQPGGPDVDVAKTWRFLGDVLFDLGRVRGRPAHERAHAAFETARARLADLDVVSSARERAIVTVGRANCRLALGGGHDVELLRQAIELYEEALPGISAEAPDARSRVERSLGQARAMLSVAVSAKQVQQQLGDLAAGAAGLQLVADVKGRTVQDAQAELLVRGGLSSDAVVGGPVRAAVEDFKAAATIAAAAAAGAGTATDAQLDPLMQRLFDIAHSDAKAVSAARAEFTVLEGLRRRLRADLAAGKVTAVRRVELEEILDEMELLMMTSGEDMIGLQGQMARLAPLIQRVMALKPQDMDDRLDRLHQALKADCARPGQAAGDAEAGRRLFEASARLAPKLTGGATDQLPRLWPLAVQSQQHLRRQNVMIAFPLWDCPEVAAAPEQLFVSGPALEGPLGAVGQRLSVVPLTAPAGGDVGQLRWNQLRSAGAAIFDLRGERGPGLAQVYYELGLARAIGLPLALLCGADQTLPFDLDQPPVRLRGDAQDEDRLTGAIYQAYTVPYQSNPDVNTAETFAAARRLVAAATPAGQARVALGMVELAHDGRDATLMLAALRTLVALLPGRRAQLHRSSHPPRYPEAGPRRLFHVMPFSTAWSSAAMNAAEAACRSVGATYVRGDRPDALRVLRSIWDEVGLATHVAVDLTEFNLNVAYELGLAHACGRPTLLVVRGQDGREGTFPAIAKLQVRAYADEQELGRLVGRFIAGGAETWCGVTDG